MKKKILLSSLVFFISYENALAGSRVELDQSQDIFFDAFNPSTFSLQVLQAKDQFNPDNLIIGGSAELDAQYWSGDKIEILPLGSTYQQSSGIYWTEANLDAFLQPTSWSSLFLSGTGNYLGSNDSNGNYFYSQHAFVLFGNLNKAPVYSTVGINTIPFGVFLESGPWGQPLTALYFSPAQAPQVSMAYYKKGWNFVATGFQNQSNYEINYAYSLYYNKELENFSFSVGAGYLSDLPTNATTSFTTHRSSRSREFSSLDIGDLGAILDINGSIQFYAFSLGFEYDQGSKKMVHNTQLPYAYAITANYEKILWNKDTTFGVGYSNAFNLNQVPTVLPGNDLLSTSVAGLKNIWDFNVSRSIFKNTFLGLDFQKVTTNPQLSQSNKQATSYTTTLDLMIYL